MLIAAGNVERAAERTFDATHILALASRTLTDALALSDEGGTVLAVNAAYQRLYGFAEPELVGRSFAIIFPDEQRPAAEAAYRDIFTAGTPSVHPAIVRRADGADRTVESRTTFITRGSGRVAMLSAIHDTTALTKDDPTERSLPGTLQLDALRALHDEHVRPALGFAHAVLHDIDLAERVVEDSLLAMWRAGVSRVDDASVVRPLVLSVVRRTAGQTLLELTRSDRSACRPTERPTEIGTVDRWWARLTTDRTQRPTV